MRFRLLPVLLLGTLLVFHSAAAASIVSQTGSVTIISAPSNVGPGALESDSQIVAFAERQAIALPHDILVDISVSGTSPTGGVRNLSSGMVSAGTQIDSYFVHFDAVGEPQDPVVLFGSITFDRDVLGLVVLPDSLAATHDDLGSLGTTYADPPGLEIVGGGAGQSTNDQITLSADRRTVSFNLRNRAGADDFRVITAVPEPSTLLLLAVGAAALAAWRSRGPR